MKKLYVVGVLLTAASLAGCSLKITKIPTESTGAVQEITWTTDKTIPVISGSEMEEFTGEAETGTVSIDSWTVPTVSGSDIKTPEQNAVTDEVKKLIETRKTQPADSSKLTEEDIGLMEQIIQKVQNLGK